MKKDTSFRFFVVIFSVPVIMALLISVLVTLGQPKYDSSLRLKNKIEFVYKPMTFKEKALNTMNGVLAEQHPEWFHNYVDE